MPEAIEITAWVIVAQVAIVLALTYLTAYLGLGPRRAHPRHTKPKK